MPRPTGSTAAGCAFLEQEIVERAWTQRPRRARCGLVRGRAARQAHRQARRPALRHQGDQHPRRPARLRPAPDEAAVQALAGGDRRRDGRPGVAPAASARRCSPRSTAAAWRRGRPARRRAAAPTCCRPAATSPRSIRAPFRPAPPRRSARAPPSEVVRRYLQDHGEPPRALVHRSLGLGHRCAPAATTSPRRCGTSACTPVWDKASSRVTGIEVLPLGRARPAAHRRDAAHLRPVPRPLRIADRAVRPGGARGGGARRTGRRTIRSPRRGAAGSISRACSAAHPGATARAPPTSPSTAPGETRAELGAALSRRRDACLWQRRAGARGSRRLPRPRRRRRPAGASAGRPRARPARRRRRRRLRRRLRRGRGAARQRAPELYHLDTSRTDTPKARRLAEEIARVVRGRLDQSALDRRHARARPSRRRRDRPGASTRSTPLPPPRASCPDALFDAMHAALIADDGVRCRHAGAQSRRRRRHRRAAARRAGRAACGRRGATPSITSCARVMDEAPTMSAVGRRRRAGARELCGRCRAATACSCACGRACGGLRLAAAAALADARRALGNGHIDLTRRANLQLRGVSEDAAGGPAGRAGRSRPARPRRRDGGGAQRHGGAAGRLERAFDAGRRLARERAWRPTGGWSRCRPSSACWSMAAVRCRSPASAPTSALAAVTGMPWRSASIRRAAPTGGASSPATGAAALAIAAAHAFLDLAGAGPHARSALSASARLR